MLIIVVLLFGICWCPLQVYHILQVTWDSVNEYKYINIVWFCSDWLAMSNSCYNPFIYGIYNVNIRARNFIFVFIGVIYIESGGKFTYVLRLCIGKIQT